MKAKLTELSVARLRPPKSGRLEVWDSTLPAFGLRVTSNGARSYVVAIRKPGARHPSRIKVGEPGRTALADARTKARQMMETGGAPEPEPEPERPYVATFPPSPSSSYSTAAPSEAACCAPPPSGSTAGRCWAK
jgi:hypothetical protein